VVLGPATVWVTTAYGAVWQGGRQFLESPFAGGLSGLSGYQSLWGHINELGLDDRRASLASLWRQQNTQVSYWDGTWHDSATLPAGIVDVEVRATNLGAQTVRCCLPVLTATNR